MRPSEPKWRDPNVVTPPNQIERASRGAPDAERKAFERWAEQECVALGLAKHPDGYMNYATNIAWMAWQEAASGHVVLLEALRRIQRSLLRITNQGLISVEEMQEIEAMRDEAAAAIKQAERT